MITKKVWNEELANIRAMKTLVYGLSCDTGNVLLNLINLTILIILHQLIISKLSLKMLIQSFKSLFFMVTVCHVLLGVSCHGCTFMLRMVQHIIHLTLLCLGPDLSQGDEKLLSDIPMDPCATKKVFCLENKTTILAVCPNPSCHFTYEPTFQNDLPIPLYPDTCNHHEFRGGKKCGTPLLKL